MKRVFRFNGQDLPDPNPEWTTDKVRNSYANTYPEFTTATIKGPKPEGDLAIYTVNTVVGTKG